MATEQPTLLYVDDNPDDLVLMQLAVAQARARFDLQMASGYYEAVDYLTVQGKFAYAIKHPKPVLMLIDYFLGTYDGAELTRWVRERPAVAGACVVILAQSNNAQDMAACYAAGADCYLTKRGTFEGLIETVRVLDECLRHHPPRLEVLRKLAMPADLMQKALRKEMREGLAENRRLLEELKEKAAELDRTGRGTKGAKETDSICSETAAKSGRQRQGRLRGFEHLRLERCPTSDLSLQRFWRRLG